MTKQEEIEEIKQVLIKTCKRCRSFEEDYMQSKYAEALYNAGYRKIDKLKTENKENCWKCIEAKRVTEEDYAKLQEEFANYQIASDKEMIAQVKQAKIDVLNELKKKKSIAVWDIDEMIAEYKNE